MHSGPPSGAQAAKEIQQAAAELKEALSNALAFNVSFKRDITATVEFLVASKHATPSEVGRTLHFSPCCGGRCLVSRTGASNTASD